MDFSKCGQRLKICEIMHCVWADKKQKKLFTQSRMAQRHLGKSEEKIVCVSLTQPQCLT